MVTYANIVIDFRLQKEDPHCIQITAEGNLIKYKGDVSTQTVDLAMSKLLWNSIISTEGAQYICLDIYFLPNRCSQLLQVHEDATVSLPGLD
jgi:hypothetical protein